MIILRLWLLMAIFAFSGCRSSDEKEAVRLCDLANNLEETNPKAALKLRLKIWEELPTTGTRGAIECALLVRERMGKVRTLVSHDTRGDSETVEGCAWAADAFEVFSASTKLPFRRHWVERLMERCVHVVGRAWTRETESEQLAALHKRLKKLSNKTK